MSKPNLEDLAKLGLNRYEAVIVAARHARHLNLQRLRQLEQMKEDPEIEVDSRKISMLALSDLLQGKVKFSRPESM